MYRPQARAEYVAALISAGGRIVDSKGLASGKLTQTVMDLFDHERDARSASGLLRSMEADKLIRREMRGRRTFRIELVDTCDDATLASAIAKLLGNGVDHDVVDMLVRRAGLTPPVLRAHEERPTSTSHLDAAELSASLRRVSRELADAKQTIRQLETDTAALREQLEDRDQRLQVALSDVATLEEDLQQLYQQEQRGA